MAEITGEQRLNQGREELEKDLASRINADTLPAANIMVAGITGTGKSTLINAIFGSEMAKTGSGRPVTEYIKEYYNGDIPIHIWDTVGFELDSQKMKESIKSIKSTIASKSASSDQYDRVHAIWYCINSGCNKYQEAELDFIKELHSIGVPFIIVLTQCSGAEEEVNALENEIKKESVTMGMGDINVVQVLALPVKCRGISTPIPAFGLEDLVNITLELLPCFIKSGFIAAQRVSQSEKRNECEEIICEYVRKAQVGFWDRVPLVNVFLTDGKIMKMFRKLGKMYNTVLSVQSVEQIMNKSGVDFKNNFFGLISPIDMGYGEKITKLLENKKSEGFSVQVADVEKNNRAARMIAFYGYTFIDSIEELWKKLTDEQLKDVDMVVTNLIAIINKKLKERKERFGG